MRILIPERHRFRFLLLATCALILALAGAGRALAHEERTLGGKFRVEVGWEKEPAYVNQPNAATIQVSRAGDGTPVEGVDKTLRLKIAFEGGTPKEFALRSSFAKKGLYRAELMPGRVGRYLFTFTGKIEDLDVNETFESGPGRFDDVTALEIFPAEAALAEDLQAARAEAAGARTLALIGVAVGALGLLIGGAALLSSHRK